MHFQATLAAITLAVAGIMVMLFAYSSSVFSLPVVFGTVLLADGLYVSFGGLLSSRSFGDRRYFVLWGVILAIIGVTLMASTVYTIFIVAPYVIGALLLIMGIIALWGEASRD
ncbi:MAG: hypothetical protein QXQ39_07760 [Conexivisphaerales archaeon]